MAIGKWIGGFLGLFSGSPLGVLAGFALGSLVDGLFEQSDPQARLTYSSQDRVQSERNSFLFSLMVLSAHIISADGKIMHSEMEFVRRFLRTNFNAQAETEGENILLRLFEQKKQMGIAQWNAQIQAVCRQIGGMMPVEQRLQLVAYLCEIAKADGNIAPEEREALRAICLGMGLDGGSADQMLGLGGASLEDAYKVLGISAEATDEEVRKAYKKMALQHHPDRVASLGEDVRKAAEKKFQEIGEAKDRIYKARGMK